MKKSILLGFFAALLLLSACASPGEEVTSVEQSFSAGEMELVLTSDFTPVFMEGYELCLIAQGTDVYILKEPFSLAEELENMTLEEYGNAMIAASELGEAVTVQQEGEIPYYQYTVDTAGGAFTYVTCLYKTSSAFWVVQFVMPEADAVARRSEIFRWATSVSFSQT